MNMLINKIFIKNIVTDTSENFTIKIIFIEKKTRNVHVSHLNKYRKIVNVPENKCPICLDEFKLGEYFRELQLCNHIFHKKCIDKWFLADVFNMNCPICRTSYMTS